MGRIPPTVVIDYLHKIKQAPVLTRVRCYSFTLNYSSCEMCICYNRFTTAVRKLTVLLLCGQRIVIPM